MTSPTIINLGLEDAGIYGSVNLNGFTLANHARPPENATLVLGYRVPHLPEVWYGIGYLRGNTYWLGPRGLDPHYAALSADQVVIWKLVELPFAFNEGQPGTSDYIQYRYLVGNGPWETEEEAKRERT